MDEVDLYGNVIRKRAALGEQVSPDVVSQEELAAAEKMQSAISQDQAQLDALSQQAQAPSALENAAKMSGTAAMASGGNPYVMGAALGLQGLAAVDSAKRQEEQAKIDAYNKKIMAQRSAARNIFA